MAKGTPYKKMTAQQGSGPGQDFFKESFRTLQDPRRTTRGNLLYPLEENIVPRHIGHCCGLHRMDDHRRVWPHKDRLVPQVLSLQEIPSHDAISDLFSILDPTTFADCFLNWVNGIATKTNSGIVAIDGKTIRGAASRGNRFPQHIVTAFCSSNKISLGQRTVADKSNEVTAIPELLEVLMVKDCLATIDAMGCQKDIAAKIKSKGAEYILAVKDNQRFLHDDIKEAFLHGAIEQSHQQVNTGHGRIEKRTCRTITDLSWACKSQEWKGLQTLIEIQSHRTAKATGEQQTQVRHYLSSAAATAQEFNEAIREHWAIENNLHWNLDVIFNEDGQLKRVGNSAQNYNVISKAALALVENEKTPNMTKPLKRLRAAHDDAYRELVLKV